MRLRPPRLQSLQISALTATFFFLACAALPAQPRVIRVFGAPEPIILDGAIDPAWTAADSVTEFTQQSPYHGAAPTYRTVARLLTTDQSLYCLIVAYAPEHRIERQHGFLDNSSGDFVSLMLDTFGDRKSAYKFAVTAGGVRSDARLLDDARNRDYSWDGVWFAEARVHPWGYVVEMEIPYRSIQYDENLDSWGLDFDRWIPATSEDIYWSPYEENEGQRISKFGRMTFAGSRPSVRGMNLEVYPVAMSSADYVRSGVYDISPSVGVDLFYNPSPRLTLQMTGNPDFAQIEADPYDFNISRYETYFDERRPFFTEGNEIFMASGRQRNMGFYTPLELFYSRRIGRRLPDGQEVPLLFGSKAFGRAAGWEYGGFVAATGETDYRQDGEHRTEERATFASGRLKRRILDNSDIGVLMVGKNTRSGSSGVIDIDGALRGSGWQLAYQVARSFGNGDGDYAASAGLTVPGETWLSALRGRAIGNHFDIDEVGFVPWRGTAELIGFTGPRWYFNAGTVSQVLVYGGGGINYEHADLYTDALALLGFNMQFRANWGYEINLTMGKVRELDQKFTSFEATYSTWIHTSPTWDASLWGGYARTYNFDRDWLAFYSWTGGWIGWHVSDALYFTADLGQWIEGNPDGGIEDITWNARPALTVTPVNDLSFRLYVDNVFVRSADRMQRIITGFLVSWNFLPKSWIYFAINDIRDRSGRYDSAGRLMPERMHVIDRAAVLKVKYLYYF